jgi:hypothetical protein
MHFVNASAAAATVSMHLLGYEFTALDNDIDIGPQAGNYKLEFGIDLNTHTLSGTTPFIHASIHSFILSFIHAFIHVLL